MNLFIALARKQIWKEFESIRRGAIKRGNSKPK